MSKEFPDYIALFSRNVGIATLTSVSFAFPDIMMQHLHTKHLPGKKPTTLSIFSILASRAFMKEYAHKTLPHSIKGSFAKITGKEFTTPPETILDHPEMNDRHNDLAARRKYFEEHGIQSDPANFKSQRMTWGAKFGFLSVCALAESFILQTISNKKILATHANFEKNHGRSYMMPVRDTLRAKAKFHFIGMPAKTLRSGLQIAALVSTEDVQDKLHVSENIAQGILACSVGLIANVLDKIYMQQLTLINAATISAPGMWDVCKTIGQSMGWRGYFVGGMCSIGYTYYAYPAIKASENIIDGTTYHFTHEKAPLVSTVKEIRESESFSEACGKAICAAPALLKVGFFSMVKSAGNAQRAVADLSQELAVAVLKAHDQNPENPFSELPVKRFK
ncbi:MAG: hypothetical protein SFW66_05230 [Gammaproteobacteria bacterium]|nr:hypothetical protein [Gammaproteobacteria bacterium]